ncbi:MAG: hypothetical protein HY075_05565, partial [Deltaproteobacteria bacterium]|nr:hypothetical protein [Deltaproteobacteria bacterium]
MRHALFLVLGLAFAFCAAPSASAAPREIVIPTTPPTDQADTLQCWAVSATARLDVEASRAAGAPVKLSAKYAVYAKTRAEVVALVLARKLKLAYGQLCETCKPEPVYYEQGGIYPDAVQAAKRYGVVPEEAYPGFPEKDEELFRSLNRLLGGYAEHRERLERPDAE